MGALRVSKAYHRNNKNTWRIGEGGGLQESETPTNNQQTINKIKKKKKIKKKPISQCLPHAQIVLIGISTRRQQQRAT